MGRLLVFLARLNEPDGKALPGHVTDGFAASAWKRTRGRLVEPDGQARVVGYGQRLLH